MNSTSPSPVAINSTTVPSPAVVPPTPSPLAIPSPSVPSPAVVPSVSTPSPVWPSVPSSAVEPSPSTPSVPSSNFPAISPSSVQAGSPFADDILLFLLVALLASVCLRWGCRTRTNKAAQQYNRIDDPFDVETELIGIKTQYIPEIPEPELPEENTV
jgi:hypothetical protein